MTRSFDWRPFRLIPVVVGALVLLVVVAGSGLGRVSQVSDPARAQAMWPWNPVAPIAIAQAILVAKPDAAGADRAESLARRALQLDASQALAYSVLGMAMDVKHDPRGRELILLSDRFSRRLLLSRIWLIEDAVNRGDIDTALRNYDIALRTSGEAPALLFPVLLNAAADPNITDKLAKLLRARPLWRDAFLAELTQKGDPLVAYSVLRAGVGSKIPESARQSLVARLVAANRPDLAYGLAAAGITPLHNDVAVDLARSPGRLAPFGWSLSTTDMVDASQDIDGTFVAQTRSNTPQTAISRLVALAPGQYVMAARGEFRSGSGTARWTASCFGGNPLGAIPATGGSSSTGFSVPAGCAFQWLRLEVTASLDADHVEAVITSYRVAPLTAAAKD
ncbi:hypothetical protein U1701_03190 [Sphingomonas sp. PB2P19]